VPTSIPSNICTLHSSSSKVYPLTSARASHTLCRITSQSLGLSFPKGICFCPPLAHRLVCHPFVCHSRRESASVYPAQCSYISTSMRQIVHIFALFPPLTASNSYCKDRWMRQLQPQSKLQVPWKQ
jgi:hypothetical protein